LDGSSHKLLRDFCFAVTRSKLVDRYYDEGGEGNHREDAMEADFTWTMQGQAASVAYPSGRFLLGWRWP
jgi:hypothetical protein